MRDFEAYYAAGTVWNAGGDAYSQAIWPAEQRLPGVSSSHYEALPFVGPPALLPVFGLIARMPFGAANALWRALVILALGALAALVLRLSGRNVHAVTFLAAAVAALGFGPLTSALALGQLALIAYFFAVLAQMQPVAALLAWVQPNVALTLVGQALTRRGAIVFGVSLAVFALACAAVSGLPGIAQYATALRQHGSAEQFSAIQLTPTAVAFGLGAAPATALAIGTAIAAAAVVVWVLLMRSLRAPVDRLCATCALLPLAMPFFHEHDLLVLFLPALLYATRRHAGWIFSMSGALLAATDWLGLAQRPDGALQTLLLVGALGLALIALHENPHSRMLFVPTAALAAIGIAAVFAQAHPAPVWPDAMGPLPNGIASMNVAAAWNAEQRATGLLTPNAVWSILRLLSLTGCALTAYGIALSSKSLARSKNPSPAPA